MTLFYLNSAISESAKLFFLRLLNNDLSFLVIIAENLRCASFRTLEESVEIGECVESAVEADFSNGLRGIHQ